MKNASIVVTGASTGIGAATAELLAREEYVVFAGVRKEADAARLAALHANIRPMQLDVTLADSIEYAAREVEKSGVPLHGLVNNAGVAYGGPLEYLPLELLKRQFEANGFGPVAVTHAFLPQLRAHHGCIVFVGSVSGRLTVPFLAAYSSSKFALRLIADAMRRELANADIKVALIEPSNVKTPIWEKGRASRDELTRRLGPKAAEHYAQELEILFSRAKAAEETAMPVERVSRAILHADSALSEDALPHRLAHGEHRGDAAGVNSGPSVHHADAQPQVSPQHAICSTRPRSRSNFDRSIGYGSRSAGLTAGLNRQRL